jgi:hypothetical protein
MNAEITKPATKNHGDSTKNADPTEEQARARKGKMISIWFFVGCLLTAYGVLVLNAGLSDTGGGGREIAMANLHVQIWWGIGLLVIGLGYVARFRPRR